MPQIRLKCLGLSVLTGILAGAAAAIFLILLDIATRYRDAKPSIIWLLPVMGFIIGWVYDRYGKDVAGGNNLILEQIHNPDKVTPLRMSPFILFGTVLTHLFGGSAGREGTVVQMGGSLADQLTRFFKISADERKILLMAGAGAGFGAAIGAPFAGMIFGMEVVQIGRLRIAALLECALASFVAYEVTLLLQAPHSHYPRFEIPAWSWQILFWTLVAGILFGLSARLFILLVHGVERLQKKWISYPPLKPAIGGLLLVILFYLEGSYRYVGLGIPVVQEALQHITSWMDPAYKAFFTALTIGTGFKGGEFIPLVFIGTTMGSALGAWIPVSFQLLGALGFAAVFAGAANIPLTCTIMAIEIFGGPIAPYALLACAASFLVSGSRSIYSAQKKRGE